MLNVVITILLTTAVISGAAYLLVEDRYCASETISGMLLIGGSAAILVTISNANEFK